MNFIQAWLLGFGNPKKFADALINKPAPHWGLGSLVLRGMMDSLLLYLPVTLMNRQPPTPSYLTFFPTENYYQVLIWLTPIIFMVQGLLGAAVIHVCLRLRKIRSNYDQILNITGMSALVVSTILVVWDWLWFFIGDADQFFLGISHLIIDIWWFVLVVTSLDRIMKVSRRSGIVVSIIALIATFPFAVIFMRSPF
jgi:hypothetical protein